MKGVDIAHHRRGVGQVVKVKAQEQCRAHGRHTDAEGRIKLNCGKPQERS